MDPIDQSVPNVAEIEFREAIHKLMKHRQTIISAVVIAVVLAMIYSAMALPIFTTSSRILVDSKPPKIIKVDNQILPEYTDSLDFFNSQIEVLKSHSVAELVFKDLGSYEPWGRRGKPADKLKPLSDEQRVGSLLSHIKVSPVRMTQVITVTVEDPDPGLAARIANTWTRAYVLFSSTDQLSQRRSELEADLSQQLKYLKDKHPVIIGLRSEIDAINDKINQERDRVIRSDTTRALASDITNVKVLDRAQVPLKPARPRKVQNALLGLILGLFFGGVLAFVFESLDQTVKSPVEMERMLKLTSLVVLPKYELERDHPDLSPEFLSAKARHSTVAEAFRSLRTAINFNDPDRFKKTFVITSSSPSEGKTTVAINMATVFAHSGERVLLVDADLRNPRLHSAFQIERGEGVTDIITRGRTDLENIIRKTEVPGLDLLTCGDIPPDPSEMLGSKKMKELIAKLSAIYDRILFDTPPILAATDAVVLSTQVDATLMVIKAGEVHRMAILRSVDALRSVHARLLGGVLNMADASELGGYYYYYYYIYGDNAKKKTVGRKPKGVFKKFMEFSQTSRPAAPKS